MAIKYLKSANVKNKTVLYRVDVNVPFEDGKVGDDFRIEQVVPTIHNLVRNNNKIIICGHLGRPGGKWDEKFSLKPAAKLLADLLNLKFISTDFAVPQYGIPHLIFYSGNITEIKHQRQINSVPTKDIVFLENLRFYPGEESNDAYFGKVLSLLGDVYVNDAFGVDHRKAASLVAVTKFLPKYAGLLLEKEIKSLDEVLKHSKPPFVLLMGGIKISDKVETIVNLGKKADKILLGGGIANLFFLAKDYEVGLSKVEKDAVKTAKELMRNFKNKIILPQDVVVANEKMEKHTIRACAPFEVGKKEVILDDGPKTILSFAAEIKKAKTIVWNGPLGYFEKKPFHHATMALARLIGGRGKGKAFVLAGGGETVNAIREAGQFDHIDHVSTGGGAMLEYLAGKKLPGIEALK